MRARWLTPLVLMTTLLGEERVPAQGPGFDVASIKPNVSSAGEASVQSSANGRLSATNATLRSLILRAYGIHDSQLIGAPTWVGMDRFNVDARIAAAPPDGPEALMPLLRTLLAERFTLRVHAETRELPAYILTVARQDRRLGSQIRATQADCTKATQLSVDEIRAQALKEWPPCGMVYVVSYVAPAATGLETRMRVRRSGIAMKDFATALQANVGRPIVDRTGLDGRFDLEYSFAPPAPDAIPGTFTNQPLLLVALEEQLGLKLESQRTLVPVVVIDSVERLIEN